jgi:Lipopolysaccharide-assembly
LKAANLNAKSSSQEIHFLHYTRAENEFFDYTNPIKNMQKPLIFFVFYSVIYSAIASLSSCYSFKGISIPNEVKTFSVKKVELRASNAPPALAQLFSERLRQKIRNESRLVENNDNPDVVFAGAITTYDVLAVAPQPGERSGQNRLNVEISIDYSNAQDEKQNWQQTFSQGAPFPATQNLLSVQEALLTDINNRLAEDIFNRAFTNW